MADQAQLQILAERKAILDAVREELRRQDYLPIMFDFDRPVTRDLTGTMPNLLLLTSQMPRVSRRS
ncbi:MAG TPA: hypothetical protein VF546_21770 [Pyrinomonadaceae bacterium]|jgi:hypothetical protein